MSLGTGVNLPQNQQEIANQAFQSAVSPLQRSFQNRLSSTVEDLSRRGMAFGNTGSGAIADVLTDQGRIEGQIAQGLGAQLGQTALDQAFQTSEAAKSRQFQAEQAGLGRDFSAEQSGLARQFSAEQAGLGRDFQRQNQFSNLYQQGYIDPNQAAQSQIQNIYGQGIQMNQQADVDLQNAAIASGLTVDDFNRMRQAIGQGQLELVLANPQEFIEDPIAAREFELELARIQTNR